MRRTIAVGCVLVGFVAVSPSRMDVKSADAAQIASNFTVAASVTNGCALTVKDMTFPTYTSGQTTIDNGTSSFEVACGAASAGNQIPITYTINAAGGFKMTNATKSLTYRLCWDSACTQVIQSGVGYATLVDRQLYIVPYYGQIPARQSAPNGVYSQLITVTLQF